MNISTFLVQKNDLNKTQLLASASEPLAAGQIRLRIELFSLTANNITYASFGDAMGYWNFYPRPLSEDGQANEWGVIPVWGFANVTESLCDGIEIGQRFYGYYPMGNEAVLTPERVSPRGFSVSGHRAALAGVYNQYVNCAFDPFYAHGSEAIQCLLRPLFITSWLIDDLLADNDFYGSEAVIMSSASSKTAYGTAFCMAQRPKDQRPQIIGLTSPGNLAFSESLGCYDQVITYAQIENLSANLPCTYVDFAGNAALRRTIHIQFKALKYSCSVGGTHVDQIGGARDLPGPKATLFFAPAQIAKRAKEWGSVELNTRLVQAWQAFSKNVAQSAPPWLSVSHHSAADAQQAYQTLLKGSLDPRSGQIWSL